MYKKLRIKRYISISELYFTMQKVHEQINYKDFKKFINVLSTLKEDKPTIL